MAQPVGQRAAGDPGRGAGDAGVLGAYYDRMRDCVIEENNLVNHRMSWAMIIQGYLFTAFGVMAAAKDADRRVKTGVVHAAPLFGITLILISCCGLYGAYRRIRKLHDDWDTLRAGEPDAVFPVPSGIGQNDFKGRGLGIVTGYGILTATGFAWLVLFVYVLLYPS